MFVIKPILQTIKAFDAAKDQTLSFQYTGNIQGSTLRIYRKQKTAASYSYWKQDIDTSINPIHIIEADTLENGYQYKVEIVVSYLNDEDITQQSEVSDPIYFDCYITPVCQVLSLSSAEENLLDISDFNGVLQITQCTEQIPVRANVSVYLDSACTQLYIDKTYQGFTKSEGNYNCNISLHGLESSKTNALLGTYYIVAKCITNYDMEFTSEIYKVVVDYKENLPSVFQAEVDGGHVNLTVKDYNVEGYFTPSNGKSKVYGADVVVEEGENLNYDVNLVNDFSICFSTMHNSIHIDDKTPIFELYGENNFHMQVIGEIANANVTDLASQDSLGSFRTVPIRFVLLTNNRNQIVKYSNSIMCRIGKSGNARYTIEHASEGLTYEFVFQIKRIDGYYSITWAVKGGDN